MFTFSDVFIFVDETGTDQDSTILAVACIITNEPNYLRDELEKLKKNILREPFLKNVPSIQKSLSKKGFHYCEDSLEVKPKVIDLIMQLPFQAYICYQEKESNFESSDGYGWYDKLFGRLMFERLRANKNAAIRICFEQHDNRIEHRRKEIEGIIERLVRKIRSRDGVEFAVIPKVSSAGKEEICLVVADYIAAIFKDHAEHGIGKPSSWQARNFERIRSKVRVIHNYTTDDFFTRKRPFPG
jgi:hypothetical protein